MIKAKNYTLKEYASGRVLQFEFREVNAKGESIIVDLTRCYDDKDYKKSLPKLWKQKGLTDEVLSEWWSVETFVTDTEGCCRKDYDPQSKIEVDEDNRVRHVVNFDWMFNGLTEENKNKLLDEIYTRFMSAKGKTATEEKHDRVREYAKANGIETVTELPEDYEIAQAWTDLRGSATIRKIGTKGKERIASKKLLLV